MSKLDGLFGSAARAFEPMLKRQVETLWPKIDAKIDQIVPKVVAAVVPALVAVLEKHLPVITDKIIAELMDRLPQIVDAAVRAVVPDVIENAFPVQRIVDEITNRLRGLLGGGLFR